MLFPYIIFTISDRLIYEKFTLLENNSEACQKKYNSQQQKPLHSKFRI